MDDAANAEPVAAFSANIGDNASDRDANSNRDGAAPGDTGKGAPNGANSDPLDIIVFASSEIEAKRFRAACAIAKMRPDLAAEEEKEDAAKQSGDAPNGSEKPPSPAEDVDDASDDDAAGKARPATGGDWIGLSLDDLYDDVIGPEPSTLACEADETGETQQDKKTESDVGPTPASETGVGDQSGKGPASSTRNVLAVRKIPSNDVLNVGVAWPGAGDDLHANAIIVVLNGDAHDPQLLSKVQHAQTVRGGVVNVVIALNASLWVDWYVEIPRDWRDLSDTLLERRIASENSYRKEELSIPYEQSLESPGWACDFFTERTGGPDIRGVADGLERAKWTTTMVECGVAGFDVRTGAVALLDVEDWESDGERLESSFWGGEAWTFAMAGGRDKKGAHAAIGAAMRIGWSPFNLRKVIDSALQSDRVAPSGTSAEGASSSSSSGGRPQGDATVGDAHVE